LLLRLESSISTTNLTFFNESGSLVRFDSVSELLLEWCTFRLSKYDERRVAIINKLQSDLTLLQLRLNFLLDVNADSDSPRYFPIKSLSLEQIESEMNKRGYPMAFINKSAIISLTKDKVDKVRTEIEEVTAQIKLYQEMLPEDIWISELDQLLELLSKTYK
jgi:DNA topoisomerase-2